MNNITKPDYIFEVSWEVCNLVGGIYTVLSTKAKTLQTEYKDKLIFIGPDCDENNQYFKENQVILRGWKQKAATEGVKIRVGRWQIPGKPIAILVDFSSMYANRNAIYADMWNNYGVDSMPAYGDYDEACMFAVSAAKVIESYYNYNIAKKGDKTNVIAHFDEWTTGMGLLYIKSVLPQIATIFTTHATSIGRSIAGNNKPLYDYLPGYNGDQMAQELNMVSKHSLEKIAAQNADGFTTVSSITAREASQLLCRVPDVTPNGFEDEIVPSEPQYKKLRDKSRKELIRVVEGLTGERCKSNPLFVMTSGRNEFRNKGLDVYINSIKRVADTYKGEREIIAFVLVPAWAGELRADLEERLNLINSGNQPPLADPFITHNLYNYNEDRVVNKIKEAGLGYNSSANVKVVFIPHYLKGADGLLNISYYQFLPAFDLTIFPSYYEPWGYTPLESVAFAIPTITTTLSGFGMWVREAIGGDAKTSGVYVFDRGDSNYCQVVESISGAIIEYAMLSNEEQSEYKIAAKNTSKQAQWDSFISNYMSVYKKAIESKK